MRKCEIIFEDMIEVLLMLRSFEFPENLNSVVTLFVREEIGHLLT